MTTLNNDPKSGKVRIGYLVRKEVSLRTSRADLAQFMLEQVENAEYPHQSPVISN